MNRVDLAIGSFFVVLASCRVADAPVSKPAASAEPRVFVETAPQPDAEPIEDPPVPKLSEGECYAEVSDFPQPFFAERLLIRLPIGIQSSKFAEVAPKRAKLIEPARVRACTPMHPVFTIERMQLELHEPEPDDPLERVRNHSLSVQGVLEQATLIEAEVDRARGEGEWVFELPSSKLLVVIRRAAGALVVVTYEVEHADWPFAVNSLRESGRRIAIVPQ